MGLGTAINVSSTGHRYAVGGEAPLSDVPHCHAGHQHGHVARRGRKLPGISYNVHTNGADLDVGSCTGRATVARRVKEFDPARTWLCRTLIVVKVQNYKIS